jgi:RNA polymerase sigma-70 factor (ECF subfamily)
MAEFDGFYRDNLKLVYALALARECEHNAADDLVQETFLRALRHFDALACQSQAAQRAWLARVVNNLWIDRWRRSRSAAPQETNAAEPMERQALLRIDIVRALAGLAPVSRQIVVLTYYLQMSSREVGELLGMPEGTVRYRLSQCRNYLSTRLAAWNTDGREA